MYTLDLVAVDSIVETEEHIPDRVEWLLDKINREKVWRIPIILERNTLAVMDGHHRLNVAKKMGLSRIPAILMDYYSDNIIVTSWRDDVYIDKEVVIEYISKKKKFPHKTTKHIIYPQPEEVEIPVSFLY